MRDSLLSEPDPNPILDDGNPTSTGSIASASRLCDLVGISISLDPPRNIYRRGWGCEGLEPTTVICSWTLTLQDLEGKVTHVTFDLFDDDSPLIIGLYVTKYGRTDFLSDPPNYPFSAQPIPPFADFRYTCVVPLRFLHAHMPTFF